MLVNRADTITFKVQASRRPRFLIMRTLEGPPDRKGDTVAGSKLNFRTPWQFRRVQFDQVSVDVTMTYLSQSYHWRDIKWDKNYGDGTHGTWKMFNQFKEIVGSQHHKKGLLKPIDFKEWYYSWHCFIFRLDQAPGSSIVLDRRMDYRTESLNFNIFVRGSQASHAYPKHIGLLH